MGAAASVFGASTPEGGVGGEPASVVGAWAGVAGVVDAPLGAGVEAGAAAGVVGVEAGSVAVEVDGSAGGIGAGVL